MGLSWGLRLYNALGSPGLLFTLHLKKTFPEYQRVAVGPNVLLHPLAPAPRPLPSHTVPPSYVLTPSVLPSSSPYFHPTVPPGPPSSTDLLIEMVNVSAIALSDHYYEHCWICFSDQPPFYEGIASYSDNLTYTNNTAQICWHLDCPAAITLAQVVGSGLCLLGPCMLPPLPFEPICNCTFVPTHQALYLVALHLCFLLVPPV